MEAEWPFANMEDLMKFEEGFMTHICKRVAETCQQEFAELGADINKLKQVTTPFPKITYAEAIERLKVKNPALSWGVDWAMKTKRSSQKNSASPSLSTTTPQPSKPSTAKPRRQP
jgi:asparaginyl-tRNA synthetase